jgi:hypothetical protein
MVVAASKAIQEAPTAAEDATTVAARLNRRGIFLLLAGVTGCSPLLTQQRPSRFHASDSFSPSLRWSSVSNIQNPDDRAAGGVRARVKIQQNQRLAI